MKTIKKILAMLMMLAGIMLKLSNVSAQVYSNGPYIPGLHDETRSLNQQYEILGGNSSGYTPLISCGLNNIYSVSQLPQFMFDVYCDPTLSTPTLLDINVGCPNCTPANSVGYRIGDSMMLWHNGIQSSLFLGSWAGGGGNNPGGTENTFVGNLAGRHNNIVAGTTGNANTYLGYAAGYGQSWPMLFAGDTNVCVGVYCGYRILGANRNVFIGNHAGYSDSTADTNDFIGNYTGYHNVTGRGNDFMGCFSGFMNDTGKQNVFIGDRSGYWNNSNWNTFVGNHTGFSNTTGQGNSFYGKHAGFNNITGNANSFVGEHCGFGNKHGNLNSALGSNAFHSNIDGDSNVVIGNKADYYGGGVGLSALPQYNDVFIGDWSVPSFRSGDSDVFVGGKSDVNGTIGMVNNSGAFGFGAIVTASDKIILGNDTQDVGIGMSGLDVGVGPTNRLDISYYSQAAPSYTATALPSSTFATVVGAGSPTGSSGLQFRDLTAGSTQYTYVPNQGFLTVDDAGNVVYMQSPTGTSSGFGDCTTPLNPPAGTGNDPAIDLQTNSHNFWFEGNSSTDLSTNVYMGYNCQDYPYVPLAKLNVLQNSGSNNTICGYFENRDQGALSTCGEPIIGIKSLVDGTPVPSGYAQVAGWFQAGGASNCCLRPAEQYAIVVPLGGGVVSIGDPTITPTNVPCSDGYMITIWGSAWAYGGTWYPSDSTLKTNVTPISQHNNALSVVQKLNGVSFNYIDSVIRDSGMTGTRYGFIAQQVKRVLPNVVKTNNSGIEAVAYTEIIPWTVEAIKQEKQTNDSLRSTLDSLRNAFKNIQNCLSTLCGSGYAPVHGRGGNGNSGDSNSTIANIQDVTLSASANAPLLYQNIPNPFSTGTKINYYLPIGTQGATMVFYDTYGNQIKTVQLSQTGNGTLNITPDNLTGGIYSYSLVVNNNIIDTKRMILQK